MNPNFWTLPGCAYPVMENKLFTKILKQVIFYQGRHGDSIEMELKTVNSHPGHDSTGPRVYLQTQTRANWA